MSYWYAWIYGSPHTNPDGQILDGTHLHLYREGFDDKWAYTVDPELFHDVEDAGTAFKDFCRYCHIEEIPPYQEVLL